MTGALDYLRRLRWSVIGFAVAGFATTLLESIAYYRMAGPTAAGRAAFGYSLSLQAAANAALLPAPLRPDTVGGYLEMQAFAPLAILFAAWAVVAAASASPAAIVSRSIGFAIATAIAAAAACAGVLAGVASGGETVGGTGLAEAGLLLVALATACYAISMVVAQPAAAATLTAGGLLLTLFFLNSLSRIFTQLAAARWLSPFRYYDLSAPLPPGGHLDTGGFAALVAIAVAGTAIAAFASTRRDVRAALVSRPIFEPSRVRLLATPVIRDLYPHRLTLTAWCLAFIAVGIVMVGATRRSMQDLLALPQLLPGLPQYIFSFYTQLLGRTWFEVALLILVGLVYSLVTDWAAQDRDGRLEARLTAPYGRTALVLERLGGLAFMVAAVVALSGLAVAITTRGVGLSLAMTRLVEACVLLVLFSVVLGVAGSLLTSWVPRAAPALFGLFVLASYLDDQIGGALGIPGWAQSLSAFRLAGTPLATGVDGLNLAVLLLLTLAGLGSSILLIQRRDVGAWSPTKSSQART